MYWSANPPIHIIGQAFIDKPKGVSRAADQGPSAEVIDFISGLPKMKVRKPA